MFFFFLEGVGDRLQVSMSMTPSRLSQEGGGGIANAVTGRPGGGERNNDIIHPSQSLFLSVSPTLASIVSL